MQYAGKQGQVTTTDAIAFVGFCFGALKERWEQDQHSKQMSNIPRLLDPKSTLTATYIKSSYNYA